MEKHKYDESNGLWYVLQGDYYLLCLTMPEQDDRPIGIWGQQRKDYLFKHRRIPYTNLLTSCKLHAHLADINEEAEDMYFRLVKQLAEKEGVTEQLSSGAYPIGHRLWLALLERCCMGAVPKIEDFDRTSKADNMFEWVRRMNNIQNRAREVVNAELICT